MCECQPDAESEPEFKAQMMELTTTSPARGKLALLKGKPRGTASTQYKHNCFSQRQRSSGVSRAYSLPAWALDHCLELLEVDLG